MIDESAEKLPPRDLLPPGQRVTEAWDKAKEQLDHAKQTGLFVHEVRFLYAIVALADIAREVDPAIRDTDAARWLNDSDFTAVWIEGLMRP